MQHHRFVDCLKLCMVSTPHVEVVRVGIVVRVCIVTYVEFIDVGIVIHVRLLVGFCLVVHTC